MTDEMFMAYLREMNQILETGLSEIAVEVRRLGMTQEQRDAEDRAERDLFVQNENEARRRSLRSVLGSKHPAVQ